MLIGYRNASLSFKSSYLLCIFLCPTYTTESVGLENVAPSKIQGWKMQDWNYRHHTARGGKCGTEQLCANIVLLSVYSGYYNCDSTSIRLVRESGQVGIVAVQCMLKGTNSYKTTFCFGSRWKGYTNVDNRRMLGLPDVDLWAWMPFLLAWRTLLRHYMARPLPSYWLRCLSTWRRNEHVHFSL